MNLENCIPYFKDSECNKINKSFQPFKRIGWVSFTSKRNVSKLLQMFKQANIVNAEALDFNYLDLHIFEEVMDPANFNYDIKMLLYNNYSNSDLISNAALENIAKINPRELVLSQILATKNLIRVLSFLSDKIAVYFGCMYSDQFTIKFSNTSAYFKDKEESINLYCKDLYFRCIYNLNIDAIIFLDGKHICLKDFNRLKIDHFKRENSVANLTSEVALNEELKIDSYCIIPANSLTEIRLDMERLLNLLNNDRNKLNISKISPNSRIIILLQSMNEMLKIDTIIKYIPNHCELELNECDYTKW